MNVRIFLLLLLAAVTANVAAQTEVHSSDDSALPTYIRLVDDSATATSFNMDDSLFYKLSGATIFKVGRSELNANDSLIKELSDKVIPAVQQKEWELVGISLRGAASPEGPYELNVRLSKRRAKVLTDFLLDKMGQEYQDLLTVNTTAEDYRYLVLLMEQAGDKDTQRVKQLLAPCGDNARLSKRALSRADGGRLWRRLLRVYFPKLRAARVVLFFKRKPQPVVQVDERPYEPPVPEEIPEEVPIEPEPTDTVVEPIVEIRPHFLSLATNLLYDAFYMPNYGWAPMLNLEMEYYPKPEGNWTYLAQFTFPYYHRWARHKFFQLRDYHLEARRYFRPGEMHTGPFAAAYVNANKYGIGFSKSKGWQGEGLGAALKVGYVWKLGHTGRWRLEVSAAFGGYLTRYDPYVYGNPVTGDEDDYYYDYTGAANDFKKRNYQRHWIGPTEFGIKIRYDILYRCLAGGLGVNRKEVVR